MHENDISFHNASLEEHLTNSIRRAREKIYNHMGGSYSASNQFSLSHLQDSIPSAQTRNRTSSQRHPLAGSRQREDKSVLASAMKTLQEKIAQLEIENKELKLQRMEMEHLKETGKNRFQKEEMQLSRLVTALRQREAEVKKLGRENSELNERNLDLSERVQDLEEEVERLTLHKEEVQKGKDDYSRDRDQQTIIEQEERIADLQKELTELQKKVAKIEEERAQLSKKLEEEKKINMRWIKMQECQFGEGEQKENNSMVVNAERPVRNSQAKKQQFATLEKKNKEMYDTIQRNKAKIADLTRQCKHHEQKFNEMKLIALEVAQAVNKILPNQPSHIKYLTTKILKLENNHVDSLRSFSNARRSRVLERNSSSKQRKRSLKMSDLASSAKKSREGSNSKSHKKRQINEQQVTRSEKKAIHVDKSQEEVEQLEKEVLMLMKKYRNYAARADKDKSEDISKKCQEISQEYNKKKNKLDQLKKNLNAPAKPSKKDARD